MSAVLSSQPPIVLLWCAPSLTIGTAPLEDCLLSLCPRSYPAILVPHTHYRTYFIVTDSLSSEPHHEGSTNIPLPQRSTNILITSTHSTKHTQNIYLLYSSKLKWLCKLSILLLALAQAAKHQITCPNVVASKNEVTNQHVWTRMATWTWMSHRLSKDTAVGSITGARTLLARHRKALAVTDILQETRDLLGAPATTQVPRGK